MSPSDSDLYVRRGRIYEKKGEIQLAVTDLRFAAQLAPNDKKTWLYLGDVFLKVNELDQAMTYYEKAIALDAAYDDAYSQMAQVWVKRNDPAKAREAFDKAVASARYRPERFLLMRESYRKNGSGIARTHQRTLNLKTAVEVAACVANGSDLGT